MCNQLRRQYLFQAPLEHRGTVLLCYVLLYYTVYSEISVDAVGALAVGKIAVGVAGGVGIRAVDARGQRHPLLQQAVAILRVSFLFHTRESFPCVSKLSRNNYNGNHNKRTYNYRCYHHFYILLGIHIIYDIFSTRTILNHHLRV